MAVNLVATSKQSYPSGPLRDGLRGRVFLPSIACSSHTDVVMLEQRRFDYRLARVGTTAGTVINWPLDAGANASLQAAVFEEPGCRTETNR